MIQEKDMHATRPMGDNFFHILSILIIFRCNFSFATYIPQYSSTIQLGLFAIWYVMAVFKHKDMFHQTITICWPLIVFLCINMAVDDIFLGSWTIITKNYTLLLIIFLVYLSYSLENDSKYKKIMIAMIIVEFVFVSFNTLKELTTNPMYARMLASMKEDLDFRGVAGFGHIYSYTFMLSGFIAVMFSKVKTNKIKVLMIFLICLGFIIIFKASYLISMFIIFFQGIYCAMIRDSSKSVIRAVIASAVILFVIIAFSTIYDAIYSALGSDLLQEKFDDIAAFFSGNSAKQMDGRIEKTFESLGTFFKHPLLGIYNTNTYEGIGRHSGFADMLGMFGALRGGLLIMFFYKAYKYILNLHQNNEYQRVIKNVAIIFLLYTFVNPYESQVIFVSIFITTPLFAELVFVRDYRGLDIKDKKEQKEKINEEIIVNKFFEKQ